MNFTQRYLKIHWKLWKFMNCQETKHTLSNGNSKVYSTPILALLISTKAVLLATWKYFLDVYCYLPKVWQQHEVPHDAQHLSTLGTSHTAERCRHRHGHICVFPTNITQPFSRLNLIRPTTLKKINPAFGKAWLHCSWTQVTPAVARSTSPYHAGLCFRFWRGDRQGQAAADTAPPA